MNPKITFVVWSGHSPRASNMAAALNTKVQFQYEVGMKKRGMTPLRYLMQAWQSWQLLERERPDVVIARTPPVFAPLVVAIWAGWRRKHFVMDCDTGSFHSPKWQWALRLHGWLARRAILTLVIDQAAFELVQKAGAKVMILEDKLPQMVAPTSPIGSEGATRLAVVSSFDVDEPVAEVFAAARLLPHITFYNTGDPKRADAKLLADKPENVVLTGYLRGGEYSGLLDNVDAIVVLTNEPNALNCGAYEALSIHKPAVVSDQPEMRRYFNRGFVHVANNPTAIVAGIEQLLSEQAALTEEVKALRAERSLEWEQKFETVKTILAGADGASPQLKELSKLNS